MAGATVHIDEINTKAGAISRSLMDAFDEIAVFQDWLIAQQDTDLEDLGFATEDITLLRSAFNDLSALRLVYMGQATQETPADFRTFPRQLAGVRTPS